MYNIASNAKSRVGVGSKGGRKVTTLLGSDSPPLVSPCPPFCQDLGSEIVYIEVSIEVRHIFSQALEWGYM